VDDCKPLGSGASGWGWGGGGRSGDYMSDVWTVERARGSTLALTNLRYPVGPGG